MPRYAYYVKDRNGDPVRILGIVSAPNSLEGWEMVKHNIPNGRSLMMEEIAALVVSGEIDSEGIQEGEV